MYLSPALRSTFSALLSFPWPSVTSGTVTQLGGGNERFGRGERLPATLSETAGPGAPGAGLVPKRTMRPEASSADPPLALVDVDKDTDTTSSGIVVAGQPKI